jgi:transcriptional regulator with XRE-family HTH domain
MINKALSKSISSEVLIDFRKKRKESQTKFWRRFGVTQSRGSRFESGAQIPSPVSMLLKLYMIGVVKDGDLIRVRRGFIINGVVKGG